MTEKKKDVLQPVDDAARRLAKTLLRTARFGSLGTLVPGDGSPSISRVNLATTMIGEPVFLISRLSAHFPNLEADPRCSLLIGEPGKGDPLAHPRMTLIGHAERLTDGPERDRIRARYLSKHSKSSLYAELPDFAYWRFKTLRVSLNGGFGRAYAPAPSDIATDMRGIEDLIAAEPGAVAHMNSDHADAVDRYAAKLGETTGGWRLACIDPEGLDLVRGDDTARLWFDQPLRSVADLRPTLVALAKS
jgi:putative heme iron utilization protein